MKPISATLLAALASACFASSAFAQTNDPATYRTITQKAAADYKAASAACKGMSGSARTVCMEEAKVARARAEHDAVAQYNNTLKDRTRTRTALANAEYALAKVKCSAMTGADKDNCVNNARSVHTAALADAKADRNIAIAGTTENAGPIASTDTRDPAKAAAVEKCAQVAGQQPTTGCLIDNRGTATTVAQTTERAAETAADKTRSAATTVAQKTERAAETAAAKTERAAETVAAKTERAAEKTGAVVADSVITTKVKADIFKEPELKSMAIHVETEKGVVMLSGFVDSKADAEKAVNLARSVEGVTEVKSAIKVK